MPEDNILYLGMQRRSRFPSRSLSHRGDDLRILSGAVREMRERGASSTQIAAALREIAEELDPVWRP